MRRPRRRACCPAGRRSRPPSRSPRTPTHGDYASSFAMAGAKALHKAPRQIAQTIVDHLDLAGSFFDKVEIAGPGFLNFTLGSKWYGQVLTDIQAEGKRLRRGGRGPRREGDGGVRLRQPHRPHAHRQRPGRRAGRRPGQRAGAGGLRRVAGVLRQRRGQPDPQVRHVHRRPLPPAGAGGGELPLPRGRLPRGRHQGAGPGLPGAARPGVEGQARRRSGRRPWPSSACP